MPNSEWQRKRACVFKSESTNVSETEPVTVPDSVSPMTLGSKCARVHLSVCAPVHYEHLLQGREAAWRHWCQHV